ncbi:MAG: hypothetical protein GX102_01000 [Porphyromonadaceae bacterium]|nr:hypothetical protein [Porphyromonadaceae bacterium]
MKKVKTIGLFAVIVISFLGYFRLESNPKSDSNLQLVEQKAQAGSAEYFEIKCSNYNNYVECKVTAPNPNQCYAISWCP